jgi:hypothetical protein
MPLRPRKGYIAGAISRSAAWPTMWIIGEGRKCLYYRAQRSEADKHECRYPHATKPKLTRLPSPASVYRQKAHGGGGQACWP